MMKDDDEKNDDQSRGDGEWCGVRQDLPRPAAGESATPTTLPRDKDVTTIRWGWLRELFDAEQFIVLQLPGVCDLVARWRAEAVTMRADIARFPQSAIQLEESASTCEACADELEAALRRPRTQPASTNAVDPQAQPSGTLTPRDEHSSSYDESPF